MRDSESLIALLVLLLILLAPAFVVHISPQFPGSFAGGLLGIVAAVLMASLLVYPLVKYWSALRIWLGEYGSLGAILSFHIYAGLLGALAGIIHSGHSYKSPIGIALVILTLLTVLTGFFGRRYQGMVASDLNAEREKLNRLRTEYDAVSMTMSGQQPTRRPGGLPILALVEGIADLEHSIGARDTLKRLLSYWVVAHVISAILLYAVLTIHIGFEIYLGLRWLQ